VRGRGVGHTHRATVSSNDADRPSASARKISRVGSDGALQPKPAVLMAKTLSSRPGLRCCSI
jgi:hypothetical protein